MIARLRGVVLEKTPARVLLDVHGVGYQLAIPLSTFPHIGLPGQEATLHTYLAVRETSMELFGFFSMAEKEIFELLLGVTGIGPKLALAVLSGADVHLLRKAIASGDVDLLIAVPGIGKKTAQRILVELREKVGERWEEEQAERSPVSIQASDAIDALVALGYPRSVAASQVRQAVKNEPGLSAEALVRKALALAREAAQVGSGGRR